MTEEAITLSEALFTTRSTRHFKPDPVPKADLEFIIEAATMAPSAGNLQMWAFVVVTDPEQIYKIGLTYREVARQYIRDGVLADPETDDDRRTVYTRAMHNVEHFDEAPAVIVPCLTMPAPDDANVASGFFGSIFPAIQNILLAARSRCLGSIPITLATDYSPIKSAEQERVRDLLKLPEGVDSVALIPIGYPKGEFKRPWRNPWQEVIHWDHW